jgi:hypothetical protein
MAIKQWHMGKIVLLWAWGIALCVVLINLISRTTNFVPGFILIGIFLAILLALSVITWKWFSGRERGVQNSGG